MSKAIAAIVMFLTLHVGALCAQVPRRDSTQSRPRATRILGVYDDLGVVENAEVLDLLSCRRVRDSTSTGVSSYTACAHVVTSPTGNASLSWVLSLRDTAFVQIRKMGYSDTSLAIAVGGADTAGVVIVLNRVGLATMLPTVTVIDSMLTRQYPLLRGFFERQRLGIGKFIAPGLLRAMEERGIESVDVALSYVGANPRRAPTLNDRRCLTAIYLDGQRIAFDTNPGSSQVRGFRTPQLAFASPLMLKDFDAIEFYKGPGSTPHLFLDPEATCGSLVLWTRSR